VRLEHKFFLGFSGLYGYHLLSSAVVSEDSLGDNRYESFGDERIGVITKNIS